MLSSRNISFKAPYNDSLVEQTGLLTRPWQLFIRLVHQIIDQLGIESYDEIVNNQSVAKTISGLKFNPDNANYVVVEFLVQRVTTGAGATELLERGELHCVYKPKTAVWVIDAPLARWPNNSGLTFTITNLGEVQYTSTNITGLASVSKITYRARFLAAKT